MPNKNYLRGYNAERRCKADLEAEGYYVIRSAGSHSMIDIVGFDLNHFRLIQIRRQKYGEQTRWDEMLKKLNNFHVPSNCTKELWEWHDRKGWTKTVL